MDHQLTTEQDAKRYRAFRQCLGGHVALQQILQEECDKTEEGKENPSDLIPPTHLDIIMDEVIKRGEAECKLVF